MARYLLSVHTVEGEPRPPMTDDEMEHLGGFYIVEAEDLDAALAWGSKTAACIMRPIEVRPLMDSDGA